MSGHHPFHQLTKDFSPERLAAIQQRRQALEKIDLHELLISAALDWEIDPNSTPIERVETSLQYLRQAIRAMGGELSVRAKFPNDIEVEIGSLPTA
jgi:hypothetical protein